MPPFDQNEIKEAAEIFFAAADDDRTARLQLGMTADAPRFHAPAVESLAAMRKTTTDDEKFAEIAKAISDDPRITKHLPELAIRVLTDNWEEVTAKECGKQSSTQLTGVLPMLRVRPEFASDNKYAVSGTEVGVSVARASQQSLDPRWDPVYRRALKYFAEYAKFFRQLDDEELHSHGSSSEVTRYDLTEGIRRIFNKCNVHQSAESDYNRNMKAINLVMACFAQIDSNRTGAISHSEGMTWLTGQPPAERDLLSKYLPQMLQGLSPMSETWSLSDLRSKKSSLVSSYNPRNSIFFLHDPNILKRE